jgi:hypothetical protein
MSTAEKLVTDSTMSLPTLITMLKLSRRESTLQAALVRLDNALEIAERLMQRGVEASHELSKQSAEEGSAIRTLT